MSTENTEAVDTTETKAPLEIVDIQSAVAVIDHAAEQGAFKGWQIINEVAALRTRLAAFLAAVEESQKAANEAAGIVAEEAPVEAPAPKKRKSGKGA